MANFESLERLILDLKESLEREMQAGFTKTNEWLVANIQVSGHEFAELRKRVSRLEKGQADNGNP